MRDLIKDIRHSIRAILRRPGFTAIAVTALAVGIGINAALFSVVSAVVLDAFALLALLMASLGLYGVISYLVEQRTQEPGIRIALGAQRRNVLRLVLTHGIKMASMGVAAGLLASLGLTHLLSVLLYGVNATDPATFAVISVLLMLVAVLACYVPARRATKVDPLVALRYE